MIAPAGQLFAADCASISKSSGTTSMFRFSRALLSLPTSNSSG